MRRLVPALLLGSLLVLWAALTVTLWPIHGAPAGSNALRPFGISAADGGIGFFSYTPLTPRPLPLDQARDHRRIAESLCAVAGVLLVPAAVVIRKSRRTSESQTPRG